MIRFLRSLIRAQLRPGRIKHDPCAAVMPNRQFYTAHWTQAVGKRWRNP